jgi:hypothetical protein
LTGNPPKPPDPIFFLDRTHGRTLWKLLNRIGLVVIPHADFFPQEEKDAVWIARCGRENWVILSGDKAIERAPENRQAVIDAKCKVVFFNDTNSRSEEWAAAIIVGRQRLLEIIARNNGPLFVTIDKQARSHISSVRFAGDGGPKPLIASVPVATPPQSPGQTLPEPKPERKPQQGRLFT